MVTTYNILLIKYQYHFVSLLNVVKMSFKMSLNVVMSLTSEKGGKEEGFGVLRIVTPTMTTHLARVWWWCGGSESGGESDGDGDGMVMEGRYLVFAL